MNIYKVIAQHVMLPTVDQYVPEYMLDDFMCGVSTAQYQNIDVTLMEKEKEDED